MQCGCNAGTGACLEVLVGIALIRRGLLEGLKVGGLWGEGRSDGSARIHPSRLSRSRTSPVSVRRHNYCTQYNQGSADSGIEKQSCEDVLRKNP